MGRTSAGLLMYRTCQGHLEVLLVHPGGPFWKHKDLGAWSIPKGEVRPGEELLETAVREFREELGLTPHEPYLPLTAVKQKGGKTVHAWAFAGDCDPAQTHSNSYSVEWPPHSGRTIEVPEVDQAAFFDLPAARRKINVAQAALLDELELLLSRNAE